MLVEWCCPWLGRSYWFVQPLILPLTRVEGAGLGLSIVYCMQLLVVRLWARFTSLSVLRLNKGINPGRGLTIPLTLAPMEAQYISYGWVHRWWFMWTRPIPGMQVTCPS